MKSLCLVPIAPGVPIGAPPIRTTRSDITILEAIADMTVEAHKETLEFQAEVSQVLNLVIRSLYSNKEIFLRELISNASDAADKLRFEALSDDALYEGDSELKIRVSFDKEARTITVSDNGIGMDRHEVAENIGTIAKSGTKQFFQSLTGDQVWDQSTGCAGSLRGRVAIAWRRWRSRAAVPR